ncbi:MAG: hypothetical protein ABI528_08775 [bacterium]
MKKIILYIAVIIVNLVITKISYSLGPTYALTVKNFNYIQANVLEFEIYMRHTNGSSSNFEYDMGQYMFNFNTAFANGGTLTYTVSTGSNISELPIDRIPSCPSIFSNQLRVTTLFPPGAGNGTEISETGNGTKIVRMRLQTTACNFSGNLNLTWRTSVGYYTKVYAYVGYFATKITGTFSVDPFIPTNSSNVSVTYNSTTNNFLNLISAFTAINSGGVYSGKALTININKNTIEPLNAVLNGGIFTSCLIKPTANVSITASGSCATELIILDGADNVTIDGEISGTRSLTLNGAGSAFKGISMINASSDNFVKNISIRNCKSSGIAIDNSSSVIAIEKNDFRNDIAVVSTANFSAIDCQGIGSIDILKNNFYNLNFSSGCSNFSGIKISSGSAASVINVSNNFLTLSQTNISDIRGISITSAGTVTSNIYFNTIYLSGAGSTNSYGIYADIVSSTIYKQKNNISINKRTAGTSNFAFKFNSSSVSNVDIDYNSYTATDFIVNWNTISYKILPIYQCAVDPNEQNTTFKDVNFVDAANGDLHLTSPSIGDYDLIGISGLAVLGDIDLPTGRSTSTPYMGADESTPFTFNGTIRVKAYIDGIPVPDAFTKHLTIEIWECNAAGQTVSATPLASTIPPATDLFSVTGTTIVNCPGVLTLPVGNKFYIKITYPGAFETWSKDGGELTSGGYLNYDFTTSASQAYNGNTKTCGCKNYIYNGDTDNNGFVDSDDLDNMMTNSTCPAYGYPMATPSTGVITDFNGDGVTNCDDLEIVCKAIQFFATVDGVPLGTNYVNRPPSLTVASDHDVTKGQPCTCP